MTKQLAVFGMFVMVSSCSEPKAPKPGDDAVAKLIEWSQKNPPVGEHTWKDVRMLECRPTRVDICKAGGCVNEQPVAWQKWEPGTSTYSRCTKDGCDSYQAQVSYSGSWANLSVPEKAMLARVTASGQFVEVATQMDAVLVYRGQCVAGQ